MAVGQLQWKEQCQSTQAFPGLHIVLEPYKLLLLIKRDLQLSWSDPTSFKCVSSDAGKWFQGIGFSDNISGSYSVVWASW